MRGLAAAAADTAGNAAALGGFAAGQFLTGTKYIFGSSRRDLQPVKTVTVTAPVGYRVIGGGASIEGTPGKVAILSSAPAGKPLGRPWRQRSSPIPVIGS